MDAQKLLRQKNLTLQRIKGLQEIVAENDLMKDDAELVYLKYEKRLHDLGEIEKSVNEKLQARLNELDTENKSIKTVLFDAKLQFRSNEITEEAYQQISTHTNELIEHINIEKSEINNVKMRLAQQTLENIALTPSLPLTTTSNAKADYWRIIPTPTRILLRRPNSQMQILLNIVLTDLKILLRVK